MKNLITILFILITLFFIKSSFGQQSSKPANVQNTPAKLISAADTLQYILGAFIGQWFVKNGFTVSNQILFKRGMDDVIQNKPLAMTLQVRHSVDWIQKRETL